MPSFNSSSNLLLLLSLPLRLNQLIQDALNKQIAMEAQSLQAYLTMASWVEIQPGLDGATNFFYQQSDEERVHMLKLIWYMNEQLRAGVNSAPASSDVPEVETRV
jgi:ferritin